MSSPPTVPLFNRLPEIYRIKDAEGLPPDQLRAYLEAVEAAFSAIHENIRDLYHDLFIDTCDDWVIAYLADLVGTSHLKGDPRTLRADVADTIALRRRKGTLLAIERLAADLTGWPAHCVELRENLVWNQHLNHQRPDAGGLPPYAQPGITRFAIRRGGTLPVRDPARLSLLGTPFDAAGYTVDVKPAVDGAIHYNVPNLAIFLWRLLANRLPLIRPLIKGVDAIAGAGAGDAKFVVNVDLSQLDRAVRLFQVTRNDPNVDPPRLTSADEAAGPIAAARLDSAEDAGVPASYVAVDTYDPGLLTPAGLRGSGMAIDLFLPSNPFKGDTWTFRGDNLCAWSAGLRIKPRLHEIVIDPDIGRVAIGVGTTGERDALTPLLGGGGQFAEFLLASYTYGSVGPVGAHPISRVPAPTTFQGQATTIIAVNTLTGGGPTLHDALQNLHVAVQPVVIEIHDSLVHDLDISAIAGSTTLADGAPAIELNRSLIIRAASGHRPIVRLAQPLRFRPVAPGDPSVALLVVRFEGIYLTHGAAFPLGQPLVARAAVAGLEFLGCTLDPGGYRLRNNKRAQMAVSIVLAAPYGFADPKEESAFSPVPHILLQQSVSGALAIDGPDESGNVYRLTIDESIVDAGAGVSSDPTGAVFAITDSTGSATLWGPALDLSGATFFGRVRVEEISGSGGIFTHRLEVHDNQKGCLHFCYFRGEKDRLPQHLGCVTGTDARLSFTSEWFHDPGYAQILRASDPRILTGGPGDDQMGAFGFFEESHKWINLHIRLREFMPLGVRPLVVPVT